MDNKIVEIETNKLDFDPKNPRFFRLNDASNAATVIEEMLDDESVHDLMLSIGQREKDKIDFSLIFNRFNCKLKLTPRDTRYSTPPALKTSFTTGGVLYRLRCGGATLD